MQVLVVEDSMTMRRVVVDSVRSITDADVLEAASGEEALEIMRATPDIRLVLLDWYLPGMSGLDVIEAAQAEPEIARIPIVMITAEREKQNVIDALRTGADNYIVKPFTQAVFRRKVGPFLRPPEEEEPGRAAGSLVGNLSQTSPLEVVQLISMTRKTGVLTFESSAGEYRMYFRDGQIDHAEGEGREGEEAIEAASGIDGGTFAFRTKLPQHPTTVRRQTDVILIKHLKRAPEE